jgi:hypothetical protein
MMHKEFISSRRYGYGAVEETFTDSSGVRTIMTGIKPAKDADAIAGALNDAYERGATDALGGASLAILSSIAARPSKIATSTIKEQATLIVEAGRRMS